jgi:hypothetical protein
MIKKKNKKVKLEDLASSIDLLARITKKGFDKVDLNFANVKYDIREMKEDVRKTRERQDEMYNLLDGYVKSNEDMKQEFKIMKNEINSIKDVLKQKLGVRISAIA